MESVPLATTTGAMSCAGVLRTTGPARQGQRRQVGGRPAGPSPVALPLPSAKPAPGEPPHKTLFVNPRVYSPPARGQRFELRSRDRSEFVSSGVCEINQPAAKFRGVRVKNSCLLEVGPFSFHALLLLVNTIAVYVR